MKVSHRMEEAEYPQLSPRDSFPEEAVERYIIEPHKVPKWLYYLDRSKEIVMEKHEDGITAEGTTVPLTEEQFFNSVARHRSYKPSSIYLTLFKNYEEVLDWAKTHANNTNHECQIWNIDGEKLRGKSFSLFLVGASI